MAESIKAIPEFKHNHSISIRSQPANKRASSRFSTHHPFALLLFLPFSTPKREQSLLLPFLFEKQKIKRLHFPSKQMIPHTSHLLFSPLSRPGPDDQNQPRKSLPYFFKLQSPLMMQTFSETFCVPAVPHLRPIADSQMIDAFCLQDQSFTLEEGHYEMLGCEDAKLCDQNQEETMEIEEECFFGKRRHNEMMDYTHSKRLMLSKLQRIDRAPTKRRHY